jgi:putative membrane protein
MRVEAAVVDSRRTRLMQRIQHFAITLASACGLLLLGCQPNTQTEPPPDESSMPGGQSPGQTPPMDADDAMPEEPMPEEEAMPPEEGQPGGMGEPGDQQLSMEGQQFIQEAAVMGMAEVEMSRTAMTKIKDQKVKDFAQKMIDDHTRMNQELETLAGQLGAKMPTEMPEAITQKKEEMQKLSGKKLEQKYVEIMVDDHDKAVELFRDQSERQEDPELQRFASTNLPILEQHLEHAKAVQAGKPYMGPQAKAPTKTKAPAGKVAAKP